MKSFLQAEKLDGKRYAYASGDPINRVDSSGHYDLGPYPTRYGTLERNEWSVTEPARASSYSTESGTARFEGIAASLSVVASCAAIERTAPLNAEVVNT